MGSIWEYNLTDDAYWNDGVPFTADDVEWTIEIQIGANFMTYWAYQPYTRWIDHVEKVNDYKVRIFFTDYDTKAPTPVAFGDNLFIPILPKHMFIGKPSSYVAQEWAGYPAIGTGPFMGTASLQDEIIAKDHVTLIPNPYYNFKDEYNQVRGLGGYYGRSTQIQKYYMKFYSEDTDLATSIRTGICDAGRITPSTYLYWLNDPVLPNTVDLQSFFPPTGFSKQIGINAYEDAPGMLNVLRLDPAVQRACALAVNKTKIKNVTYNGLAEIGYGLTGPGVSKWYWEPDETPSTFNVQSAAYNSSASKYELTGVVYSYTKPMNKVMEHDIAEANKILDAAGYVWANESGMIVRKAGPLAAARMEAMGFGNASNLLNKKLIFEHIVLDWNFGDRQIGDFLVGDWEKIGVWISSDGGPTHAISIMNGAQWYTSVYSYTYNTMQTYWTGDIDPNYICYIPTSYALFGWNEFGTDEEDYNQLYLKAATTLNVTERKHWTDECSKWQYLSGCIITIVYPKTCWAWNEEDWTNQGNWSELPGLSMENYWPENPLLFRIQYKSVPNKLPVAVISGDSIGTVGEQLSFSGTSSYDPDGTIVEFNWTFDDSSVCLHSSSITRKWSTAGKHWVKLELIDNLGARNSTLLYVYILPRQIEPVSEYSTIVGFLSIPEGIEPGQLQGHLISLDNDTTWEFSVQQNGSFVISGVSCGNYSLIIELNDDALVSLIVSIESSQTIVNLGRLEIASEEAGGEGMSILAANPAIAVAIVIGIIVCACVAALAILKIIRRKNDGSGES